jgi:hypothetical protein
VLFPKYSADWIYSVQQHSLAILRIFLIILWLPSPFNQNITSKRFSFPRKKKFCPLQRHICVQQINIRLKTLQSCSLLYLYHSRFLYES